MFNNESLPEARAASRVSDSTRDDVPGISHDRYIPHSQPPNSAPNAGRAVRWRAKRAVNVGDPAEMYEAIQR